MLEPSFSRFLARSLALLEDELPDFYCRVPKAIGMRRVLLHVDDERIGVISGARRLSLTMEMTSPDVELRTTRSAIVRLVDGTDSLVDAILADRVVLRGTVDDLIAFHDGLMAYLHAAVRCPGFQELRDEYLAEARPHRRRIAEGSEHVRE